MKVLLYLDWMAFIQLFHFLPILQSDPCVDFTHFTGTFSFHYKCVISIFWNQEYQNKQFINKCNQTLTFFFINI